VEEIRARGDGAYEVVIGLSSHTVGDNRAQLLSMVSGNVSLQDDVELIDLTLPPSIRAAFTGPGHGLAGLRALTCVAQRALTCSALKPQGAPVEELAELCRRLAGAGIDVVKDDHGLADHDQSPAPFGPRVRACQRAVAASGSGTRYAPSIVGTPRRVAEQLRVAAGEGVQVVLIAPMVYGLAAFSELAGDHPDLAFLAHPAFAGIGRVAPRLLLGRLFRLYGADAVIYPNHGGRFAYSRAECAGPGRGSPGPVGGHPTRPPRPGGRHVGGPGG